METPRGITKKGDLAVTVVSARNLRSDGKIENVYCVVELAENSPIKTHVVKDKKEPVWNETYYLDLYSLDGAEVLVTVYGKRRIASDKFLGQIQIPIKALSIPKDEQWFFLTEKPTQPRAPETPKGFRKGTSIRGKKSPPANSKSDDDIGFPAFVSGEVCVRLHFVHRLLRGRSRAHLRDDIMSYEPPKAGVVSPVSSSAPSSMSISSPLSSPMVSPSSASSSPMVSVRERGVSFHETLAPRGQVENKSNEGNGITHAHAQENGNGNNTDVVQDLPKNEAIIIDNALREKQRLVTQKLEEKRELVRILEAKVNASPESNNPHYKEGRVVLREMQAELRHLEKAEKEVVGLLDSQRGLRTSQLSTGTRKSSFLKPAGYSVKDGPPKRQTLMEMRGIPKLSFSQNISETDEEYEDVRHLKMRIKLLEVELSGEKKLNEMANSKILLLEKENRRLEEESQDYKGGLEGAELAIVQKIRAEITSNTKETKDAIDGKRKELEEKLKEVELDIEDNVIKLKQIEVELMGRRLVRRQGHLTKIERKSKRAQMKLEDGADLDDLDSSGSDSENDGSTDSSETGKRSRAKLLHSSSVDKFDMLVGKLEKLDKLDELLRKIDAMKYMPIGDLSSSVAVPGRSFSELKVELEELQKIICDETSKYTEKMKEDANIKYEKTFIELSQTTEFKMEQAQAIEEKRKLNEPLNKDALQRMLKIFTADSIRNDPEIKDKVSKNPELLFIGMDPKAILAKHQNDFSQFLLRITEIDELRAIRASLPKFRNDQKRQLEWVEVLETKIDQVTKSPPPKVPPPKLKPAKTWRAKSPIKASMPPTDMFAELLAKRKAVGPAGLIEARQDAEKKEDKIATKLKLAPRKLSTGSSTPPLSPPSTPKTATPPPPPPPPLHF